MGIRVAGGSAHVSRLSSPRNFIFDWNSDEKNCVRWEPRFQGRLSREALASRGHCIDGIASADRFCAIRLQPCCIHGFWRKRALHFATSFVFRENELANYRSHELGLLKRPWQPEQRQWGEIQLPFITHSEQGAEGGDASKAEYQNGLLIRTRPPRFGELLLPNSLQYAWRPHRRRRIPGWTGFAPRERSL